MWCIQHGDNQEKSPYWKLPISVAKKGKITVKNWNVKEYESGTFKQTELASKYGIGKSTVSDILKQRDALKKFYSICF